MAAPWAFTFIHQHLRSPNPSKGEIFWVAVSQDLIAACSPLLQTQLLCLAVCGRFAHRGSGHDENQPVLHDCPEPGPATIFQLHLLQLLFSSQDSPGLTLPRRGFGSALSLSLKEMIIILFQPSAREPTQLLPQQASGNRK